MNNQQAQQDKEQKIKWESALLGTLFSFLNKTLRHIRLYYGEVQQLYHIQNDRQVLQDILTQHYMNVQETFIKSELNRLNITLERSELNNLRHILDNKASLRATVQSGYIIQTMQKKLNQQGVDNLKIWQQEMKRHFKGIVVNTETQGVAEDTKNVTIGFVQNIGKLNDVKRIERIWHDVGDNRVRLAHMEAHGQIQPFGSKFLVGGELLRYPGDPVGRPDNIINCRCTLLTRVIK